MLYDKGRRKRGTLGMGAVLGELHLELLDHFRLLSHFTLHSRQLALEFFFLVGCLRRL